MNELFEKARSDIVYAMKEYSGFGTYGEKSIHAVLKKYLEPNTDFHETGILGSIADICRDGKIYEIQTHALYRLKPKLEKFLPHYKVCIVYPVITEKTVYTVNPNTQEIVKKRKSPSKGYVYDFLPQVYGIRDFLENENLSFKIMMIKASDYRTVCPEKGQRRGIKFDTVPDELVCEVNIESISDYKKLIPPVMPENFTSADYAKAAHLKRADASTALNILNRCGIIEKIDKKGHAFVYRIIE